MKNLILILILTLPLFSYVTEPYDSIHSILNNNNIEHFNFKHQENKYSLQTAIYREYNINPSEYRMKDFNIHYLGDNKSILTIHFISDEKGFFKEITKDIPILYNGERIKLKNNSIEYLEVTNHKLISHNRNIYDKCIHNLNRKNLGYIENCKKRGTIHVLYLNDVKLVLSLY